MLKCLLFVFCATRLEGSPIPSSVPAKKEVKTSNALALMPSVPIPSPTPTKKPEPENCYTYLTNTPAKKFFFGDKHIIYMLVNTGVKDKRQYTQPLYKHKVLQIDLTQVSIVKIAKMSMSLPVGVYFLPYGNPPIGFTAIDFLDTVEGCQSGNALLYHSFARGDKKLSAYRKKISLVESNRTFMFFDLDTRQVLNVDTRMAQFRKLNQYVIPNEKPIFSDPSRRMLYTFTDNDDFRGIYNRSSRQRTELPVPTDTRILQQGSMFALGKLHLEKNRLEIKEFPLWTGKNALKKRYMIALPKFYVISEAQIAIDFSRKIIALGGAVSISKRKWRRIFFIDYKTGKIITQLDVEVGSIANTMQVDPYGLYIAIDVAEETSNKTTYLALFDLESRTLRKLSLSTRKQR